MRMHLRCIWIKPSNEFPLLYGSQIFLPLDHDDLVCPNSITQSLDILIYRASAVIPF